MPNAEAQIDLVAKTAKFLRGMKTVRSSMVNTIKKMEQLSRKSQFMLLGFTAAVGTWIKIASDQETAEKSLDVALEATNQSTLLWSKHLQEVASSIQEVTIFGDELNLMTMTMFTNQGVLADGLEDATKAAIGLSTALGQNVKTGIRHFSLAITGNFAMLSRYIPAIRLAETRTEKFAVVTEFARRGFLQAKEATQTFTGRLRQLKNAFGDLIEFVGGSFTPRLKELITHLKEITPLLGQWAKANQKLIFTFTLLTGSMLAFFAFAPRTVIVYGLLAAGVGKFTVALKSLIPALSDFLAMWAPSLFAPITATIFASVAVIGSLAAILGAVVFALVDNKKEMILAERAINDYTIGWGKLRIAIKNTKEALSFLAEQEARIKQVEALELLIEKEEEYQEILKKGGIFSAVFSGADKETLLFSSNKSVENLKRQRDEMNKIISDTADVEMERQRVERKNKPTEEEILLVEALRKTRKELEKNIDTVGFSEDALVLYEHARKGATDEELRAIEALQRSLIARKKEHGMLTTTTEAYDQTKTAIKNLRNEIDLLTGKRTEDQLKLLQLLDLGDRSEEFFKLLDRLKQLQKEKVNVTAKQALEAEADAMREAVLTAKERLDLELERLKVMRQQGIISAIELAKFSKLAFAKIPKQDIDKKSLAGQFNSLQGLFKRIQSSAASIDPTLPFIKQIAVSTREAALILARNNQGLTRAERQREAIARDAERKRRELAEFRADIAAGTFGA